MNETISELQSIVPLGGEDVRHPTRRGT
jgi:hypothetical protein